MVSNLLFVITYKEYIYKTLLPPVDLPKGSRRIFPGLPVTGENTRNVNNLCINWR